MAADPIVDKLKNATTPQDIPEEVSTWLGRLVLLYGVPFHYLIPQEEMGPADPNMQQRMLPPESIRFFYVDPIWIQCLVQGACSVGNTDAGDTLIDNAMNSLVQPNQPDSGKGTSVTTKAAASVRDRLRQQYEGIDLPQESQDLQWPLMGFLLRSAVVKGWRGLEIMAYRALRDAKDKQDWAAKKLNDDDQKKLDEGFAPLQALRIEQLGADVMLGIFNGRMAQLVIRQPQEGLHFGLTPERASFIKTLRSLGFKNPADAGQILQNKVIDLSKNNLVRAQAQPGVINIAKLADQMKSQLGAAGELRERFTSAEFAVEMIEAAGEFTFVLPAVPGATA